MVNICSIFKKVLLAIFLFTSVITVEVFAQDTVIISYFDTYVPNVGTSDPVTVPIVTKSQRVNSRATTIISKNKNLNEDAQKALNYAISVWSAYINFGDTVYIEVLTDKIQEDVKTSVLYTLDDEGMYVPTALHAFLKQIKNRDSTNPDGIITINLDTEWDYNLNENIAPNSKNLAHCLMRAIARIMGFGSTVLIDEQNDYCFQGKNGYNVFDGLISNADGVKLTSIPLAGGKPNSALKAFIETPQQTFFLNGNGGSKEELAPPPYCLNNQPFACLNDKNSLMSANLCVGDYNLQIDNKTSEVLNSLGWNTSLPLSIKIISDDIADNGLASAYSSHTFRIDKGTFTIENPQWTFCLPLANGKIETNLLSDNNLSACISPIGDESIYAKNTDGDIEGILKFLCRINGKEIEAAPFKVYLELKPFIESVNIERVESNYPLQSYNVYYKVKYRGAEQIKVSVEEEHSSILNSLYIKEPFIADGIAKNISSPYYAWIDFIVENKYGESTYTVELQPGGVISNTDVSLMPGKDVYEVYDLNGNRLCVVSSSSEIVTKLHRRGMFIVKHYNGDRLIEIRKEIR